MAHSLYIGFGEYRCPCKGERVIEVKVSNPNKTITGISHQRMYVCIYTYECPEKIGVLEAVKAIFKLFYPFFFHLNYILSVWVLGLKFSLHLTR